MWHLAHSYFVATTFLDAAFFALLWDFADLPDFGAAFTALFFAVFGSDFLADFAFLTLFGAAAGVLTAGSGAPIDIPGIDIPSSALTNGWVKSDTLKTAAASNANLIYFI